ncbi:hypothetical protein DFH08DRAFT_815998 [Mycena albidolilacea]|uniref:Uncharacterized protein n=1 Tax=Mycena albidolilacea TaxID=1033008 RepID=A0AAD6ZMD6_9AGAR|nr:hypothetical protein DFH08DRAFT_815998 [Mycena albidolilacea]
MPCQREKMADGTGTAPVARVPWNGGHGHRRQAYLDEMDMKTLIPSFGRKTQKNIEYQVIRSRISLKINCKGVGLRNTKMVCTETACDASVKRKTMINTGRRKTLLVWATLILGAGLWHIV